MSSLSPLQAARKAGFKGESLPWFGAFMVDETRGRHDVQAFCYIEDYPKSHSRVIGKIRDSGKSGTVYDYTGAPIAGFFRDKGKE